MPKRSRSRSRNLSNTLKRPRLIVNNRPNSANQNFKIIPVVHTVPLVQAKPSRKRSPVRISKRRTRVKIPELRVNNRTRPLNPWDLGQGKNGLTKEERNHLAGLQKESFPITR